jgi:hypothetical protein
MDEKAVSIHGERQSIYGPWRPNMTGTSMQMDGLRIQWESCNPGKPLPPWWFPLTMVAAKCNRIASGVYHADNFDDIAVYLKFVEDMQVENAASVNK